MSELGSRTVRTLKRDHPQRLVPLLAVAIALSGGVVTACSKSGGGDNKGGATPAAPQQGPAAAAPTMDVSADELSPNGCLDLQLLAARFENMPAGAMVREYTKSFEMAGQSVDGKALPRLRNMAAETAFANYSYNVVTSVAHAASLPAYTQTGCSKIVMTDQLNGTLKLDVAPDSTKSMLHLKSADGLKEQIYNLKSARELEVTISGPRIDRCPDFMKAQAKTVRSRAWGTQAELEATPPVLSLDLLKKIAVAVVQVPTGITQLLRSGTDTVTAKTSDLEALKTATLDPQIVACPFDATPPSGDEPPPPEETTSPTPAPSATPVVAPPQPNPTAPPFPAPVF